ncbi:MAG: S8 family serine peptidase [Chloroflexota bacterium]|nr:S8 family serine peptidase [Chloroflexota bacterium]
MPHRKSARLFVLIVALTLIVSGSAAAPFTTLPEMVSPGVAFAAPLDSDLLAAFAASADGQARFWVIFDQQADLSAAEDMDDWSAKGHYVFHTLQATAARSQASLLQALQTRQVDGAISYYQPYWIVNVIVVQGDRQAAESIAAYPGVAEVMAVPKIEAPQPIVEEVPESPEAVAWGVTKIGADQVWTIYGVRGEGIVSANIDTGVRYSHEALVRQYRGNQSGTAAGPFEHDYNWWDARSVPSVPGSPSPFPVAAEGSHGTHVMGSQVGENASFTDQIGVAPGSQWIAAYGCCPNDAGLLGATQWMLAPTKLDGSDPDPDMRPHIINNSWGGPGGFLYFAQVIDNLRMAGIFNSYSAGNSGSAGCGSLGAPGDNPPSFNSGATNSSDGIGYFSSRGPNPFSGDTGPDVAAPGVNVYSAVATSDTSYQGGWNGTSMAAPHTAGTVALLWSLEPDLIGKVAETEAILRGTALSLTGGSTCGGIAPTEVPNNTFGWGRVDAKAAADMVFESGTLAGTLTDSVSAAPIAGAQVTITRNGKSVPQTTDENGQYSFTIGQGSYAVEVEAYGYLAGGASPTVSQDDVTQQDFALVARPVHLLSGMVTDGTNPVWGAELWLKNHPLSPVMSDALGDYSMAVAEGDYTLKASMPGFEPFETEISITADLTDDIVLTPTADYYALSSESAPGCQVTFDWVELQGQPGTVTLNLADDVSQGVVTGGNVSFYGTDYTIAYIGSNGFVQFGQSYNRVNGVIPFEGKPNNAVYGFATDLNPENGTQGKVYHRFDSGQWIVQYDDVEHWLNGYPETFELVFDDASGEILLQYQTVSSPGDSMMGIENDTGTVATLVSKSNWPAISDGLAIKLVPFRGLAGAHNTADVNCDGEVDSLDAVAVGNAWNTVLGDAGYVQGYDLDMDGDVDIADIQQVVAWWGWMAQ